MSQVLFSSFFAPVKGTYARNRTSSLQIANDRGKFKARANLFAFNFIIMRNFLANVYACVNLAQKRENIFIIIINQLCVYFPLHLMQQIALQLPLPSLPFSHFSSKFYLCMLVGTIQYMHCIFKILRAQCVKKL